MKLVFIDNLKEGMVVAKAVCSPNIKEQGAPLVEKNTPATAMIIESLYKHGIRFVYIDEIQTKRRQEALRATYSRFPPIPKAKPLINEKLRNRAVENLQTAFEAFSIGDVHQSAQIVKQLDSVVEQLVESLVNEKGTFVSINDLKSYDEYTYHHSLSVAVMSIAIGQYLNFSRQELHRLGMCSIMHDIGKTAVPLEIIQKPSRLTDEEFDIIKGHSHAGMEYLLQSSIADKHVHLGVLAHHEKLDGTGYPNKLAGDEIPVWSRIISVADVYDALTSARPYRNPMQPSEAIEYIMGGTGTLFDYDMVNALLKKVELYPVGSNLELSNGKFVVVVNNANQMRPVVRYLDTGEIVDLYDRNMLNVVVTRLIPDDALKA